jgi:hypothetical protein
MTHLERGRQPVEHRFAGESRTGRRDGDLADADARACRADGELGGRVGVAERVEEGVHRRDPGRTAALLLPRGWARQPVLYAPP